MAHEDETQITWCKERFQTLEAQTQKIADNFQKFQLAVEPLLTEIQTTHNSTKNTVTKLEKEIWGNGKSGISETVLILKTLEDRRSKVISYIVAAFISQLVIFLFSAIMWVEKAKSLTESIKHIIK
jgi:hypothetical protein